MKSELDIKMFIRIQTKADNKAIFTVHEKAFGRQEEANLVEEIRQTAEYINDLSLVAENGDGEIIGHALFSEIFLENEEETRILLALAPLAVVKDWQGMKIGSALMEEGIRLARQKGYPGIIVLGHASYYPKFGFQEAKNYGILPPFAVPSENFLALELYPKSLDGFQGTIRYPSAFHNV
ncbi:acetyltransferase [Listeria fleischmannii subsp. coloradonensis]|nr:acetyltransferase [Listeria fleischmannii subsp. coloradonensis]